VRNNELNNSRGADRNRDAKCPAHPRRRYGVRNARLAECDRANAAPAANQVLNNLGGTQNGRTFVTGDGLTNTEWAESID
jgi:hypothetical protein